MKILIDTNIILDYLLEREPFFKDSETLFNIISENKVTAYVSATTLTDIFYIARKQTKSIDKARQAILFILKVMEVCSVDRTVIEIALQSGLKDFEDAVQVASAISQGLDAIVTRNSKDFVNEVIPILTVNDLLQQIG